MAVATRIETHQGVERLHLAKSFAGRPLYWAIVHRIGSTLVDTGPSSARAGFRQYIARHRVTDVLTTHEHEDHIGNHAVLPRDVVVHAPTLAKRFLDEGHPPFPLYRRWVWGYHEPSPGARLLDKRVEAGGRVFRAVFTPGHSEDHWAILDESTQALFSGDAYMGKFRAARLEEDVHTQVRSLRAMAELDAAVMYPAHGPVIERPRERLLDVAAHFETLARRAWRLRDRGLDVRAIRKEMLGAQPGLHYFSMGEFSADKLIVNLLRERVD